MGYAEKRSGRGDMGDVRYMGSERDVVLEKAKEFGADVAGIVTLPQLRRRGVYYEQSVFPEAESAVVLAVRHGSAALASKDPHLGQFDTLHTYRNAEEASHLLVRYLEDQGHAALALPPFIPLNMGEEKKGMVGMLDLRGAGVAAGLGVYGESGLLLTERFGPAVRLGAVVTTAPLEPTPEADRDYCDHCFECLSVCPGGALGGEGKIDKSACSRVVFRHGLRGAIKFLARFNQGDEEERNVLLRSGDLRELWQNFMTGGYYYCWNCQTDCTAARTPRSGGSSG